MPDLLAAIDAFLQGHRRCAESRGISRTASPSLPPRWGAPGPHAEP
jgi:hypothetical protein